MIVAHPGDPAVLDGHAGLIPCEVLEVNARGRIKALVHYGQCQHPLQVGPSPYGDKDIVEEDLSPTHVIPKKALRKGCNVAFPTIAPYRWEATNASE